jgi:outer membrane protein
MKLIPFLLAASLLAETLPLTLEKAATLATAPDGNLRLKIARDTIAQAEARRRQALGAFLPNVEGNAGGSSQTRNLGAFGIQFPSIPGLTFASFAGPFTVVDFRATATQSILDFASIQRYKAAKTLITAAESDAENARQVVLQQVSRAYVMALRGEATVDTARANVQLAEALLRLAESQKNAGTGTGIDVTRARVQLANEKQRQLLAENERDRAHLELARSIGLSFAVTLELSDRVNDGSEAAPALESAVQSALAKRPDLRASKLREAVAKINLNSIRAERLPSLGAAADYGVIGNGSDNMLPTRSIGVSLRVPIFDGGRREARVGESGVLLRQERLRSEDLARQVELEVRVALNNWKSSQQQIITAREGLALSENELAQAQRRFSAGVATSLELTDAQTRLVRARDNHLTALYQFNLARIDLAAATGTLPEVISSLGASTR